MSLAGLLRAHRKRKTISRYLTRLGPTLGRLYGKADHYTPEQVKRAAQEAKLPMADLCYGLSVYCTPADFDAYHAALGLECSYWDVRLEVAEHHFGGNAAFSPQDVTAHAHSHAGADGGTGHHFGGDTGHHGGHH